MLSDLLLLDAMGRVGRAISPKFNPTSGAPTKPLRLALGVLFVKQMLSLSEEGTEKQVGENT